MRVKKLPKDAIQKPAEGYPIWQHMEHKEIHILHIEEKWWISHYQPSDQGGKDYYVSKPHQYLESWRWMRADGGGRENLQVVVD